MTCEGLMTTFGSSYSFAEVIVAGNVRTFLLVTMMFQILSIISLSLVKMSTCFFYLRVFPEGIITLGSRILIGVTAVYLLAFTFSVLFLCSPVSANWDLVVAATAKCADQMGMLKAMIALNMVIDFSVMVLPLWCEFLTCLSFLQPLSPLADPCVAFFLSSFCDPSSALLADGFSLPLLAVWQLKMRLVDKVGVMACFLIVVIIIVASIFRLIYITTIDLRSNITGTAGISIFIGALEPILSLIAVSLPMLRPLYVRWRKSHDGWTGSNSQSQSNELGNSRALKLAGSGTASAAGTKASAMGSKARPRNDIELDTIFDETPEKSGSEENLTDTRMGIQVHTKWEVDVV